MQNILLAVVAVVALIAASNSNPQKEVESVTYSDTTSIITELTELTELAEIRYQYKDSFIALVLQHEGEYSNDPDDKGGETMRGITWRTYTHVMKELNRKAVYKEFRQMPDSVWKLVFKQFYNSAKPQYIEHTGVKIALVDFMWGSGLYGASKRVKHMLKSKGLPVSHGYLWTEIDAQSLNSLDPKEAIHSIANLRKEIAYKYPKYEKGWLIRIHMISALAVECVEKETKLIQNDGQTISITEVY